MKRIVAFILSVLVAFIMVGCGDNTSEKGEKPVIAVTIAPQATFVREICRDEFEIITLVKTGASPESYEPSFKEMERLENAEFYFAIGVPAEESVIPSLKKRTELVYLNEIVSKQYSELTENKGRDPHIWLSPKRVKVMVDAITNKLCDKYPSKAEFFIENRDRYLECLSDLDDEINSIITNSQVKSFITYHPSFNYFADDYGLTAYSLEEHGREATAQRMVEVADIAKQQGIKQIFYQAEASERQAKAFAEEISGKAVMLEPLSEDYVNNMLLTARKIAGVDEYEHRN